jgi:hypothetical protein
MARIGTEPAPGTDIQPHFETGIEPGFQEVYDLIGFYLFGHNQTPQ